MSAQVTEEGARLHIVSLVGWRSRLLFAGFATLPLLAPIELMFRIQWHSDAHPVFFVAVAISAGALLLSLLLVLASLSALDRRTMIDATTGTFSCAASSPVTRSKSTTVSLAELEEVCVHSERWTDGSTYSLAFALKDGSLLRLASSFSRPQLETCKSTIDSFLNRYPGDASPDRPVF